MAEFVLSKAYLMDELSGVKLNCWCYRRMRTLVAVFQDQLEGHDLKFGSPGRSWWSEFRAKYPKERLTYVVSACSSPFDLSLL